MLQAFAWDHGAGCEPLAIPGAARAPIADLGARDYSAAARLQGKLMVTTDAG